MRSTSLTEDVQTSLLREDFEAHLEKSSEALFDLTQSIASNFAILGTHMQKNNAVEARKSVEEIAQHSQTLLARLDEFKHRCSLSLPILV